ncbi:hypothetical protein FCV25MIE_02949 [Fagus crenata]
MYSPSLCLLLGRSIFQAPAVTTEESKSSKFEGTQNQKNGEDADGASVRVRSFVTCGQQTLAPSSSANETLCLCSVIQQNTRHVYQTPSS